MKKKDDFIWLFIDYRELNKVIVKIKYLLTSMDDLFDQLSRASHFLNINLHYRYHLAHVCEQDVPKTSFKTQCGHYEFLVIPFALMNALAIFYGSDESSMSSIFGKIGYFIH